MKTRGIHLQYTFGPPDQRGADIGNPLFDLISAVHECGSIQHAARSLGASYRHVWGALKQWEEALGEPLVTWAQGQPARLTPFADRLLWAERQARTRLTPHVEALRAELRRAFALADDPALQLLEIHASHDLALPRLVDQAEQHGLHLALRFAGSEEALRHLRDGRCSVAGFHLPAVAPAGSLFAQHLRPLLRAGTHKLIGSHRRCQGLMRRTPVAGPVGAAATPALPPSILEPASILEPSPSTSPAPDALALLAELAAGRWRFVNRQPGSGTRLLLDHLLQQSGLGAERIDGYATRQEQTHLAVAAAVAAGHADVGLGVQAAAHAFGLDFLPLAEECYYLVCLKDVLDTPALQALRHTLAAPAWGTALADLPGYAPQQAGEVLSLTRVLPWWNWRKAPATSPGAARRP